MGEILKYIVDHFDDIAIKLIYKLEKENIIFYPYNFLILKIMNYALADVYQFIYFPQAYQFLTIIQQLIYVSLHILYYNYTQLKSDIYCIFNNKVQLFCKLL